MQRAFLLLLLISSLVACSPQSRDSTWSWTFPHGVTISLPSEWRFTFRVFDNLYLQDSLGDFQISQGINANAEDEARFRERFEDVEEIHVTDEMLVLRTEYLAEEAVNGIHEVVSYFVIFPSETSISVGFPKTANIAERERLFQTILLTVQEPLLPNTLAFFGGYAGTVTYPDDLELWNWSLADSPEFRSEDFRLNILLVGKEFGLYGFSQDEIDAMSDEDLALRMINLYEQIPRIEEAELEIEDIAETSVFSYQEGASGIFVFSVDEKLWFRFAYSTSDASDLADIHEMMQSIIESYHFADLQAHLIIPEIEASPESIAE